MPLFRNILVSIDSRFEQHPALDWALSLAEQGQTKIAVVDVQRELSWPVRLALRDYEYVRERDLETSREKLEKLALPLGERGFDVSSRVLSGTTSIEIIREVLRTEHDLVIRVSKGMNSRRIGFFGSTTMRLFRKCPCPVLAVNPESNPKFQRLMATVDPVPGDEDHARLNSKIMTLARSMCEPGKQRLMVVHAWTTFGESVLRSRLSPDEFREHMQVARTKVESAYGSLLESYGLSLTSNDVHLLKGEAELVIPAFAQQQQVDVIVMGTVARTGVSGLIMGNTAEKILGSVQCSVLAVKPNGFVSPVQLDD